MQIGWSVKSLFCASPTSTYSHVQNPMGCEKLVRLRLSNHFQLLENSLDFEKII